MGHEQKGLRPAIVVSDPNIIDDHSFPLLCILPVTGTPLTGSLYPSLLPGDNGLNKRSWVFVDQIRSVDKGRVRGLLGVASGAEIASTDEALMLYLGLDRGTPE